MSVKGPVVLRWREGAAPKPAEERFETLDEALDAIEARWEAIKDGAPQVLDSRRVMILSTEEIARAMEAEDGDEAGGAA